MSKLTEAITAPTRLCSVGAVRPKLDEDSGADFDAWMAGQKTSDGRRLTDKEIWIGLQNLGHRVSQQSLGRHRRQSGECGCFA